MPLLLLYVLACARPPLPPPEPPLTTAAPPPDDAVAGVSDPALRTLLADHWEDLMQRYPRWATRLGDHRHDDRLGDPGPAAVAAAREARDGFLRRARGLDRAGLGAADALTLDLFVEELETDAALDICHLEQWGLSPRANPVVDLNELVEGHPLRTPADGRTLVARYRGMPAWVDAATENLRLGIAAGRTPDATSAALVLEMVRAQLDRPESDWDLARVEPPGDWPEADRAALRRDLLDALPAHRAALTRYAAFLADELLPHARPEARAGARFLPDGEACYAALVRRETSLPLDPAAIHRTGLDELARIHAEMRELGERLFGITDRAALFERLRADPALRFGTRGEVEAKAAEALGRAKAAMPRFFGRLPVADCVVKPIPDYEAPYTYVAYYRQPVPGEAPGEYRINSWAPETRPRFEAEVLAFHESIPGHHLQIAIAQELPATPAFRRHLGTTAYVEGWALYTERLAEEMGLYTGDLDRMGMLSFDAWRASRLVVDTGIHAYGWTRAEAEAFMLAHTPLAANNVRNEVDRYVTWPGQAVAYKVGQLEMWRLRREAEARLGARFDLPGFHDAVLAEGAVTLPVLRRNVEAWVVARGG